MPLSKRFPSIRRNIVVFALTFSAVLTAGVANGVYDNILLHRSNAWRGFGTGYSESADEFARLALLAEYRIFLKGTINSSILDSWLAGRQNEILLTAEAQLPEGSTERLILKYLADFAYLYAVGVNDRIFLPEQSSEIRRRIELMQTELAQSSSRSSVVQSQLKDVLEFQLFHYRKMLFFHWLREANASVSNRDIYLILNEDIDRELQRLVVITDQLPDILSKYELKYLSALGAERYPFMLAEALFIYSNAAATYGEGAQCVSDHQRRMEILKASFDKLSKALDHSRMADRFKSAFRANASFSRENDNASICNNGA